MWSLKRVTVTSQRPKIRSTFHTPPAFQDNGGKAVAKKSEGQSSLHPARARYRSADSMAKDPRVTVITAAMCQGNKLEPVREQFPDRFFDVGICESHAVAFAAGQCKTGLRPIVDIYSTFLQRSYDQIFQEVALQDLPVVFLLDRAGLTGPDGPTHHGLFDIGYMRVFPNLVCMAPGYAAEMRPDALGGTASTIIPVASVIQKHLPWNLTASPEPIEIGKSEVIREGNDGTIVAFGAMLEQALPQPRCSKATWTSASSTRDSSNRSTSRWCETCSGGGRFVVTVEEGAKMGGFGSAFLECAVEERLDTRALRVLALPDEFIEHGDRNRIAGGPRPGSRAIADACANCESPEFDCPWHSSRGRKSR